MDRRSFCRTFLYTFMRTETDGKLQVGEGNCLVDAGVKFRIAASQLPREPSDVPGHLRQTSVTSWV